MFNSSHKPMRIFLALCLIAISAGVAAAQERATDILDLSKDNASTALRGMTLHGNMRDKLDGGAWMVLSTIATGFGRADCGLQGGEGWLFYPALDILNRDEAYELNRLVTANFRDAQFGPSDTQVDDKKLYPISQAVFFSLITIHSDPIGDGMRISLKVDCEKVHDVWQHAQNYVRHSAHHYRPLN